MFTRKMVSREILLVGALIVLCAAQGIPAAQKAAVPKPQDKLALGENEVSRLMLLIDTNNNGKITKKEWMAFMEAEFDRLDKNKSGELEPKELAQSRVQASHFLSAGK